MKTSADAMTRAVQHQEAGNLSQAEALYRQVLDAQPHEHNARYRLAVVCQLQGRTAEAIFLYQQLLQIKPDSAQVQNNLAMAYASQGQFAEALACCREAVRLRPDCAEFFNNLGTIHNARGELDPARDAFRQAVALKPQYPAAWMNLSLVYVSQQRWQEAAACFQKVLVYEPNHPAALGALGDIFYFHLGKLGEALRCYRQLLVLWPDNAKARLFVDALSGVTQRAQVPADFILAEYESLAGQWDEKVRQRGDRSPQWLRAALEPAPPPRSLTVLDLGCGTGLCGLQFREWAAALIGVDLSPKMLDKARARGIYDELILSDVVAAVRARPGAFDLIVAADVLLYLGELGPLFDAAYQALRPGGRFAFTVDLLEGAGDYRLTPWVHFAHSRSYLQQSAAKAHLEEVYVKDVVFPRNDGKEAAGLVIALARQD